MSLKLRTVVPAVLLATAAGGVPTQQAGAAGPVAAAAFASSGASGATTAPAPVALAGPLRGTLGYRSVFEGYRAFSDQPVVSWREANDLVGRIGGWQSYAREVQGGSVAGSAATPASQGMSGVPAMSDVPAAHGGMSMPAPASGTAALKSGAANSPRSSPTPVRGVPPLNAPRAPGAASAAKSGGHSGHKIQ